MPAVSLTLNPIGSWFVVAIAGIVVTGLTLWAYSLRMRTSTGAWRWFALGLRLAAILLCVIAALRPSLLFQESKKQPATLVFLTDESTSMTINDEVRGQSRWAVARKAIQEARTASAGLGAGLNVKFYRFDSTVHEDSESEPPKPTGSMTAVGVAILESVQRQRGSRVAGVFVLSDGASNSGVAPLVAAGQLRGQQIPLITVGLGSEAAGSNSRDLAIRELVTSPTVFVKNQLQVRGTLMARGFPNQTVEVEMLVDGQSEPVARQRVKIPEGAEFFPISGLKYIPQTPGEKKITLRVKKEEGELVTTNNEVSTFVSVQKGGLNVLFVQGPHSPWEQKYFMRAVAASPDIKGDLRWIRRPADEAGGELHDEDFTPGRYDVYVLSDLPADHLTRVQQALLAKSVEKGAGLIMLGGRASFGEGGWGRNEVGGVLPVIVRSGDGQIEPDGGVKFVPNPRGLETFLMQIGSGPAESARLWGVLPPLSGINHLGRLKDTALVFGQTPGPRPEPIMVGMEVGAGRSLAFGGETWVWARDSDDGLLAHRKFWRQIVFWLAHKEDKGENDVKVTLDTRRVSVGQKLEVGVTVHNAKGEPIPGVTLETRVEGETPEAKKHAEKVELFNQGDVWRGPVYATDMPPGDYRVTVVATKDGKEVGRDNARFLVYLDDRELTNPAADRALLRQIADASGGESIPPEQLVRYLQSFKGKVFTESYSQTEREVWDNWPFLLLFTTLLVLEWAVRKRHGWV